MPVDVPCPSCGFRVSLHPPQDRLLDTQETATEEAARQLNGQRTNAWGMHAGLIRYGNGYMINGWNGCGRCGRDYELNRFFKQLGPALRPEDFPVSRCAGCKVWYPNSQLSQGQCRTCSQRQREAEERRRQEASARASQEAYARHQAEQQARQAAEHARQHQQAATERTPPTPEPSRPPAPVPAPRSSGNEAGADSSQELAKGCCGCIALLLVAWVCSGIFAVVSSALQWVQAHGCIIAGVAVVIVVVLGLAAANKEKES